MNTGFHPDEVVFDADLYSHTKLTIKQRAPLEDEMDQMVPRQTGSTNSYGIILNVDGKSATQRDSTGRTKVGFNDQRREHCQCPKPPRRQTDDREKELRAE